MNAEQLMGILRAFIPGAVALLTYYGVGSDANNTIVLTAFATLIVAFWSHQTNKPGTIIPPASPLVTITKTGPGATEVVTSSGVTVKPK